MARLLLQSQIADALAPVPPSSGPMSDQQQPAMMMIVQQQPAASNWHFGAGSWVLYMGIALCGFVSLLIMTVVCRYRWRSGRGLGPAGGDASSPGIPQAGTGSAGSGRPGSGSRPLVVIQPDRSVVFGVADDVSKDMSAAASDGGDSGGKEGRPAAVFSVDAPGMANGPVRSVG
ncbi:hypothetical protein COHA_007435 [Chlorella ohadii]|uniref:Uncharacterized protein n=1 Tax=Chlorella ohadii TaxID=2649997 RepID=A0AAD5GZW0_9CHLO|nr:hypothetical protein COHA_007435 [Chlorella ohadii]